MDHGEAILPVVKVVSHINGDHDEVGVEIHDLIAQPNVVENRRIACDPRIDHFKLQVSSRHSLLELLLYETGERFVRGNITFNK